MVRVNPVKLADRPTGNGSAKTETDIRFLDQDELEKLISAPYPDDAWGSIEPTLYLTAAMSGLRQGELLALRWRDVDFDARRIRVVQNYVRGKFDTPKSAKSGRSVPMASKVDAGAAATSRAAPTSRSRTTSCSATPTPEARLTARS